MARQQGQKASNLSLEQFSRLSVSEMIKEYNKAQDSIRKNLANARARGEDYGDVLTVLVAPKRIGAPKARELEAGGFQSKIEITQMYEMMGKTYEGRARQVDVEKKRKINQMLEKSKEYGIDIESDEDLDLIEKIEKRVGEKQNYFYHVARYISDEIQGKPTEENIKKVIEDLKEKVPKMSDYGINKDRAMNLDAYLAYKRDFNNMVDEFLETYASDAGAPLNKFKQQMDEFEGDRRTKAYRELKKGRAGELAEKEIIRRHLVNYLYDSQKRSE